MATQPSTISNANTNRPPVASAPVVPARPTRSSVMPLKECKSINDALRHPEMVDRIKQAVPRHLAPERMLRVMAMAVHRTPKLAEADLMTLLGAMLACASLGLEPNTPLGHAYLIPFEKRKRQGNDWVTERVDVNLIIGYRGFIDLARRSGSLVSIHADVVYDGDEFDFEYGSNMHLRHRPQGDHQGRPPFWGYAHAKLTDGEAFEVLPYGRVLGIRNSAQGYQQALRAKADHERKGYKGDCLAYIKNPWIAFEHEMASKTLIRRLSKMLPLSIEFMNAASLDALSETGRANLAAIAMAQSSELVDVGLAALAGPNGDGEAEPNGEPEETQPAEEKAPAKAATVTTKPKPTAPSQVDPETGEDAGEAPYQGAEKSVNEPILLPMPMTEHGDPDIDQYLKDVTAEIDGCQSEVEVNAWMRLNAPTIHSLRDGVQTKINGAARKRVAALNEA